MLGAPMKNADQLIGVFVSGHSICTLTSGIQCLDQAQHFGGMAFVIDVV